MAIEILYFARVREAIGRGSENVTPPPAVVTISDLIDWLAARDDASAEAFTDRGRLRAAIDQNFADPDAPVAGAKEISIFPPVTGG